MRSAAAAGDYRFEAGGRQSRQRGHLHSGMVARRVHGGSGLQGLRQSLARRQIPRLHGQSGEPGASQSCRGMLELATQDQKGKPLSIAGYLS